MGAKGDRRGQAQRRQAQAPPTGERYGKAKPRGGGRGDGILPPPRGLQAQVAVRPWATLAATRLRSPTAGIFRGCAAGMTVLEPVRPLQALARPQMAASSPLLTIPITYPFGEHSVNNCLN